MAKGDIHDIRHYAQIQFRALPNGGLKLRYGNKLGSDGKLQGSTTQLVACTTKGDQVKFTTASGSQYICSRKQISDTKIGVAGRISVTAAFPALAGCW